MRRHTNTASFAADKKACPLRFFIPLPSAPILFLLPPSNELLCYVDDSFPLAEKVAGRPPTSRSAPGIHLFDKARNALVPGSRMILIATPLSKQDAREFFFPDCYTVFPAFFIHPDVIFFQAEKSPTFIPPCPRTFPYFFQSPPLPETYFLVL